MATVTGVSAEKVDELTKNSVIGASIDSATGVLTLQTREGKTINVGSVDTDRVRESAIDAAYPVGSIYLSTVATNPASLLGVGSWQAWGTGRMPIGVDPNQAEFNDVEKVGGSKTHTLSLEEMPLHSHTGAPHTHNIDHDHDQATFNFQYASTTQTGGTSVRITDIDNVSGGVGTSKQVTVNIPALTGKSSGAATAGNTGSTGGDSGSATRAHNNLSPYITCFMWKRVA